VSSLGVEPVLNVVAFISNCHRTTKMVTGVNRIGADQTAIGDCKSPNPICVTVIQKALEFVQMPVMNAEVEVEPRMEEPIKEPLTLSTSEV
jgi:hypothetical protein